MSAPHASRLCAYAALCLLIAGAAADPVEEKDFELFDGVSVKIPSEESTEKMFSLQINTNKELETGRAKNKKLLERILPMFIMPFLIQSTIVPIFLSMLKFMLFKSMMVGKLALGLILLNAFKNQNSSKGRRKDSDIGSAHYGYNGHGMEEYGAYINS